MAKKASLILTPPAISRQRESSADQKIVEDMADTIEPGAWVSNGQTYNSHKDAALEAQIYKRAVARKLGTQDYKMRTRVWGEKDGRIELNTDAKGASWKFVILHDPNRQRQVRNNGS